MGAESNIGAVMAALPEHVNSNDVLARIGRHFSSEFLLEAGELSFHLVVERGRLVEVISGPLMMRGWSFALRATPEAWTRFWEPEPAPGYSDLFAMARYGHLRIEGDVGPLLENLRYVKEVVALPRHILARAAA